MNINDDSPSELIINYINSNILNEEDYDSKQKLETIVEDIHNNTSKPSVWDSSFTE